MTPSPWACFDETFYDVWERSHPPDDADPLAMESWFTDHMIRGWYVEDTDNAIQRAGRAMDIRYSDPALALATDDAYVWLASADAAYTPDGYRTLVAALEERGVAVTSSLAAISDPSCGHLAYFQNRACGFSEMIAHVRDRL